MPANTTELSDIEGQWYEMAVSSAIEAGFVNGYEDGSFRPNEAELAAILSKVIEYDSRAVSNVPEKHSVQFNNSKEVLKWATEAVQKIISSGIMIGGNIEPPS
ncbi:S-layer homology domain-containing protein [Lysinibacillus sp. FSL P2-0066]|uniref:S-layer homology domain-containing protein n=1 Tax=Lysinibacillus sp. FSL P2-0066 TaxID=2921720 RepID=UPI0030D86EAE